MYLFDNSLFTKFIVTLNMLIGIVFYKGVNNDSFGMKWNLRFAINYNDVLIAFNIDLLLNKLKV
jgi:hypothetical protein